LPRISVAMTTYNGEKYIQEQLNSIFAQTYPADEVIICDDCSMDGTVSIIKAYIKGNKLKHWTLITNNLNIGYMENFYQTIQETSGDIVFLCDQDDIWHRDKIQVMTDILTTHPEIKILNTGFREIDQNGNVIPVKRRLNRSNHNLIRRNIYSDGFEKFRFDEIIWRNISPGCTAAFTKECKSVFLERFSRLCPHDWELNIYGALQDGLYFYNKELTDYRIHGANTLGLIKLNLRERLSMTTGSEKAMARALNEHSRAQHYKKAWGASMTPMQKKIIKKYNNITALRVKLIETARFKYWFKCAMSIRSYLKLMGAQGVLNDLKYVINRRQGE